MSFENEIKFGDTYQELPKSKFQVQHADNIGQYPFYTSGDKVLTHSEFNDDDEIIFLATGGKANVKFNSGKAAYSTDTYAIKGKEHSSKYLYYLLLDKLSYIDRNFFSGSGLKHLQKKDFRNWLVSFPDDTIEEEQIVQFLSLLDNAISTTEQLIAKYQRIKTGLLNDLLTSGIDEHGNLRSEKTHNFKDSNLGRIPVEWEVEDLEKLTRSIITYGIVQAGPFIENGIPYIRTGDMSGDKLTSSNLLRTSEEIASRYLRSRVEENDIVFALRATIGKVLLVPKELHGANLTQGTARIAPKWKNISSLYFLWTMRMDYFKNQILKSQKGTTFSEITLGVLRKMEVKYPIDINEQERISNIISKHEKLILVNKRKLLKLQSLKTALMQDLLSGRVRVNFNQKEN